MRMKAEAVLNVISAAPDGNSTAPIHRHLPMRCSMTIRRHGRGMKAMTRAHPLARGCLAAPAVSKTRLRKPERLAKQVCPQLLMAHRAPGLQFQTPLYLPERLPPAACRPRVTGWQQRAAALPRDRGDDARGPATGHHSTPQSNRDAELCVAFDERWRRCSRGFLRPPTANR